MQKQDPSHIMQVGFGFFGSKVLLTAVKLGLFTQLGERSMTGEELGSKLGLHKRGIYDFFDALVALHFLEREGDGPGAKYKNTESTSTFLDQAQPSYIGGIFEMANDRLFRFWNNLEPALKTGVRQNEVKHGNQPFFETLYNEPLRLEQFIAAMRGVSAGNFSALAEKFNFSKYKTLCDVGGSSGVLSSLVAKRYPHIQCQSFDLPIVEPIARKYIERDGKSDQVEAVSGDFFKGPLPRADVITMGMILHDWNLEDKMRLIHSAYQALPDGGAFIVIESLIDDVRRENAFGLMMSLNMLIEFGDAFDYSFADFKGWCEKVGFKRFELLHLAGPYSAGIAYK
ncbi:MAG: methyltransferase [Bdellovibrionia bacterium]